MILLYQWLYSYFRRSRQHSRAAETPRVVERRRSLVVPTQISTWRRSILGRTGRGIAVLCYYSTGRTMSGGLQLTFLDPKTVTVRSLVMILMTYE